MMTAALAGGSLLGTCEVRLHDAVISGSKDYVSTLLTSEETLQLLFPFFFPSDDGSDATVGE